MNVEVPISTIGKIAPATGMGIESFGTAMAPLSIDVGGVNSPELNSNIFSMPELNVEHINEFDNVFPQDLDFPTQNIWEAATAFKAESLPSQAPIYDIFDTPQAEIMREEMFFPAATPELENTYSTVANTQQDIIEETSVISAIALQEVNSDISQAARVEDALIAIGIPQEKAEESAMIVLEETLKKKGITDNLTQGNIEELVELKVENDPELKKEGKTQTSVAADEENVTRTQKAMLPQSKEKFFERDTNADKAREEIARKAIAIVFKKTLFSEKPEVNGSDIVIRMPSRPQPSSIKSEIIQWPIEDGSYAQIITDIASAGEIFSANEATRIVNNAIAEKPAVRLREHKTSQSVTMDDVKRVIGKENVLEIKI